MSLSSFSFSLDEMTAAEADTVNPYLADPAMGLQLVTRLMAHPPPQQSRQQRRHQAHLHQLIHQSFVSLAARDDFPAEAQSFRALLALEESLEDLALFPDLANKTIVGMGGGFSAGKSRFLNTLLGEPLLPESLEPTTAIPSFLTGGPVSIVALNTFNHPVQIDADALLAITHAFYKHYKKLLGEEVGFAHVLKLLMIHRPVFSWQHLAFLDTPGYSKADNADAGQTDEETALRQLSEADHVVWLLNAKNGSIRRDDLEFLRTLKHPRPVFFVVTQADLVGKSRIRSILESTVQAIDAAGIDAAGLMAWAAPLGVTKGECVAGNNILEWFNQLNQEPKYTTKRLACTRVMDGHILHSSHALANNRHLLAALNELLPMAQQLPDNRRTTLHEQITRLKNDQRHLTSLSQDFSSLRDDMLATITQIVGPLAKDIEVKREHELIYTCQREWLKRPVALGERLDVLVNTVKTDIKRVVVALGQDVANLGLPFGMIRGALRLDPLVLVKGSLLTAEVRSVDQHHVTLAITNPNQ